MSRLNSITNPKQFDFLVDFMCKNPQLSTKYAGAPGTFAEIKELYEQLTIELNRLGPPQKSLETWRKVWADLRSVTKRKVRHYMFDGVNHVFSQREQRIIVLLDLKRLVANNERMANHLQSKMKDAKRKKLNETESSFRDDFDEDAYNSEDDSSDPLESENTNLNNSANNYIRKIVKVEYVENEGLTETNNSKQTLTKEATTQLGSIKYDIGNSLQKNHIQLQQQQLIEHLAILKVLNKIERQLCRVNQSRERNSELIEENNELLKLLLHRTTKANDKTSSTSDD